MVEISAISLYSFPRREGSSAGLACWSSTFGSSVLTCFLGGQPVNDKAKIPAALHCQNRNFMSNLQRKLFFSVYQIFLSLQPISPQKINITHFWGLSQKFSRLPLLLRANLI